MTGMTLVTGQARPSDAAALVTQPAPPTLTGTTLARQGHRAASLLHCSHANCHELKMGPETPKRDSEQPANVMMAVDIIP